LRITKGERIISDEAQTAIELAQLSKDLSKREFEVLTGIAKGQNNREIAQDLGVSPKTIDSHRTGLFKKMNVHSTASLLVKAIRTGLIDV